jgi:hypothetical protein
MSESVFEPVALDPRLSLAAFRRVSELDAEEDWALLSGVAQRLIGPSRIGNRLCFV